MSDSESIQCFSSALLLPTLEVWCSLNALYVISSLTVLHPDQRSALYSMDPQLPR